MRKKRTIFNRGLALFEKVQSEPRAFSCWAEITDWMNEECDFPHINTNTMSVYNSREWRLDLKRTRQLRRLVLLPPVKSRSKTSLKRIEKMVVESIERGKRTWEDVYEDVTQKVPELNSIEASSLSFWSQAFGWQTHKLSTGYTSAIPFAQKQEVIGEKLIEVLKEEPTRFRSWDEVVEWSYLEFGVKTSAEQLLRANSRHWGVCLLMTRLLKELHIHKTPAVPEGAPVEHILMRERIHKILLQELSSNPKRFPNWRSVLSFFRREHPNLRNRKGNPLTLDWFYQQNHRQFHIDLPATHECGEIRYTRQS